jgi:hypothetical protein
MSGLFAGTWDGVLRRSGHLDRLARIFYSAFNRSQASLKASFVTVLCASLLFWVLVGFGASARGSRDVACGGVALLDRLLSPWSECACIPEYRMWVVHRIVRGLVAEW